MAERFSEQAVQRESELRETDLLIDRTTCVSCSAVRHGPFCASCGQREMVGRHTLSSMVSGALGRVMNLERGFGFTAWHLTVEPGRVVRDFLRGRTAPYTHPFGYLLISFAAFSLLMGLFGGTGGAGSENRMFAILQVPFVALASRLLFFRTRLIYAEHLIIAMFAAGHIALILTLLQPFAIGTRAPFPASTWLVILGIVVPVYVAWMYSRTFQERPVLAALGGIAALAGGTLMWGTVLAGILPLLRG